MTRVFLIDDQPAFRRHLHQLVCMVGMDVVGEASAIPEAEPLVQLLQPDLAIVDIMLPGINGIEGIPLLKARAPDMAVILISAYRDEARKFETLAKEAGAVIFVPKDELDLDLLKTWVKPLEPDSGQIGRNDSYYKRSKR